MAYPTGPKHIETERLQKDLLYRVEFLRDFIGFGKDDVAAMRRVAPLVEPFVGPVVDGVYAHLFQYSNAKEVFLTRNVGFEGKLPKTIDELTLESDQIIFRKNILAKWARKLFTADYDDDNTWLYLDRVGEMHTGATTLKERSGKTPLHVDLMLCSALLAWVESTLIDTVMNVPNDTLSPADKSAAVIALSKILWIQNDLFARHYVKDGEFGGTGKHPPGKEKVSFGFEKFVPDGNTLAWVSAILSAGVLCGVFLRRAS